MTLTIGGKTLSLLPEKAVLLEDGTIVIADVHLGKASAFQAHGLPIPEGDSAADLKRLSDLCRAQGVTRLIINGDLFHSAAGLTPDISALIESWLEELTLPVELVIGNHDARLKNLPRNLRTLSSAEYGGFVIVHDPREAPIERPSISAHWHPMVKIGDGKQRPLRFPCYLLRGLTLVLPSFGGFTGGTYIRHQPGDRCFISPTGKVMEIPPELIR